MRVVSEDRSNPELDSRGIEAVEEFRTKLVGGKGQDTAMWRDTKCFIVLAPVTARRRFVLREEHAPSRPRTASIGE